MKNYKLRLIVITILLMQNMLAFAQNDTSKVNTSQINIVNFNITGDTTSNPNDKIAEQIKKGKILMKGKQNEITIVWDIETEELTKPVEFEYILNGYNSNWIKSNKNYVKISKLKPGKYRFDVKLANVKSKENITNIDITIYPLFWQTTWFKFLSFIFIVIFIIVVIIIYLIVRRIVKRKKK